MNTNPNQEIDYFLENIITSYEDRVQKIQTAFQSSEKITESSHSLYDHVHSSLNGLKKEREQLNTKLCEALAKNGSLRKKDYNTMMSGILETLNGREKEAEHTFLSFIETQKETAQLLKNSIMGFKDISPQDSNEKIANIRQELSHISKIQEERKEIVKNTFIGFQNLHNKIIECLEAQLEKGSEIQAQDIKNIKHKIINEFSL